MSLTMLASWQQRVQQLRASLILLSNGLTAFENRKAQEIRHAEMQISSLNPGAERQTAEARKRRLESELSLGIHAKMTEIQAKQVVINSLMQRMQTLNPRLLAQQSAPDPRPIRRLDNPLDQPNQPNQPNPPREILRLKYRQSATEKISRILTGDKGPMPRPRSTRRVRGIATTSLEIKTSHPFITSADGPNFEHLQALSIVVFQKSTGRWFELFCRECGINTLPDGSWIVGTVGLAQHLQGHGAHCWSNYHNVLDFILAECIEQEFQDMAEIKQLELKPTLIKHKLRIEID